MEYCTKCGTKLTKQDDTLYVCLRGHENFNNPAATVAVLPVDNGRVLISRRKYEPQAGMLDPIGGFVDFGEDAITAAKREVKEEVGVEVELGQILGTYSSRYLSYKSVVNIVYVASIKGTPRANDDVAELIWFDINELPTDDLGWPWIGRMFDDLREWYQQKDSKTQ